METVNWQDLLENASSDFEPIPAGRYDLVVEATEAKQSSNGKPMIVATFRVANGPHVNRKIWSNFVISVDNANALSWFFQNMNSLGLNRDYFKGNPPLAQVADALLNRTCSADVKQKTYNSQIRNEITKFFPSAGGATPAPVPAAAGAPVGIAPPVAAPAPAPAPAPEVAPVPATTPSPVADIAPPVAAPPVPF